MERLAHGVIRKRRLVITAWVALTLFGIFSAIQVSNRWFESFSIPGYSAYEANQRVVHKLGSGEITPIVAVLKANRDITTIPGAAKAFQAAAAEQPGARVSSWFTTHNPAYLSKDRKVAFAEIYPPGQVSFSGLNYDPVKRALAAGAPAGVQTYLTGIDRLYKESSGGDTNGPSILVETLIGALGALIILLFTFGTLPAVAFPLMTAGASILNTFTLIWLLTYVTDVSIIVQFLVALVGLGVAIDYSLLMIFRFREEIRHGKDREEAVVETMKHAGRSVIVSGTTVAVGLLSMVLLPLPFIRSIGIGGMLIPAVSVITAITLLPAMLYILGARINSVRVMPRRIVEGSDDPEHGFWNRWARFVTRRPIPVGLAGLAIVAVLVFYGLQLNPADAQAKDYPGGGDAHRGLAALVDSGVSPGVLAPFAIVVEGTATHAQLDRIAQNVGSTEGVSGAAAPPGWSRDGLSVIEAFPSVDAAAKSVRGTISHLQDDVLPAAAAEVDGGLRVTLGGPEPESRDFVHAVYGNFPYVLLFVVLLTFLLLTRAFRSLFLSVKAVILNLISLAAAYGIIVIIFQNGHGSEAIWSVPATGAIISWIPLMIFAFLYGLSMDYEVFMLTRMREAYDETSHTNDAIRLGLARTGKLVTSASLVLGFSFFVLSTSPGTDIKQFGIGLAAGIIFDATVIRATLVPSIMTVMGRWNWWLPAPLARALRTRPSEAVLEAPATEAV
ncbi:MAG TPA: MMPL family transporter [Gaiellaceae bacterium]|nr:MMPL family transporter [Gaiellaceae bacterium]